MSLRYVISVLAIATAVVFAAESSHAQVSRSADVKSSRAFVYHGKLVRPDGSVPTGSMSVTLKILSPDPKLCVLWSETQTVEMKDGGFSVELGHGSHRLPGASGGAAADFKQAFINNPSLTISSASCASGNSYTPTVSDDRLLAATFNDSGAVIEIAGMPIKSVPFALQAEEIGGYGLANLVKISGAGNNATLTPAEVDEMKLLANTALPLDLKGRLAKNAADPVDPQDLVTKAYYQANLPTGTGVGSVTNVSVGGSPLSVTNGTTTPQISIAQANATTSGYLTSTNWNTFNDKLGSALPTGQVFIGTAGNVAAGSFFGIGQMRNSTGTLQMPTACAASQTLTWSAVTDVLACSNIDGLNADKITAGTFAAARLGSGTADATKYLRGDGTWQTLPSGADNLGNHTATQNLNLASYKLVGNGGTNGITIAPGGEVGIGTASASAPLQVDSPSWGGTAIKVGQGKLIFESALAIGNEAVFQVPSTYAAISAANSGDLLLSAASGKSVIPHGTIRPFDVGNSVRIEGNTNQSSATISVVKGTGQTGDLLHVGSANLVVNASGNVAIGTTSASEKLEVAGKVKGTELCIGTDCRSSWPSGDGSGTVTSVGVGGLPLSVVNSSTTPTVSIAQANTTTAGYLSAADWNTFNGKQPAGAYLTSITSGNVTTALGFTPLSQTLATNQVFIGNGSNVAAASYFGLGQLRSTATGNAQFPSACAAHQTMVWSAITDVLTCSSIDGLGADKITSGAFTTARLGSGTADATKYLRGDGTWQTLPAGADNLGNHTATANLNLATYKLVGNGGSSGLFIDANGNVGLGTTTPAFAQATAGRSFFTIKGSSDAGVLELMGNTTDADGTHTGLIQFSDVNASGVNKRVAVITGSLDGPTANNRGGALRFWTRADNTDLAVTEKMRIDGRGYVGIGTTSPTSRLQVDHVYSPSENFGIHTIDGFIGTTAYNDQAGYYMQSQVRKARGTAAAPTNVQPGDTIGTFSFMAYDSGSFRNAATIVSKVDTGTTSPSVPASLHFNTTNSTGGTSTNMVVHGSGNVGIGTTSPSAKLDVVGAAPSIRLQTTSNGDSNITRAMSGLELVAKGMNVTSQYTPAIKFMSTDPDFTTENPKFLAGIVGRSMQSYTDDTKGSMSIDFLTTPHDPGATNVPLARMSINYDGNVGIGTTSPGSMLHVQKADGSPQVIVENISSSTQRWPQFVASNYAGSTPGYPGVTLTNSRGTKSATAPLLAGDALGIFQAYGVRDNANTWSWGGGISFLAAENFSATAGGTDISFGTTSLGALTGGERMRISANGNIGIATTSPDRKLDINNNGMRSGFRLGNGGGNDLFLTDNNASVGANVYFDGAWKYFRSNAGTVFDFSNGQFNFMRAASGAAGATASLTQLALLDTSGNFTIIGGAYKPGGGSWTASSDARLKDVHGDSQRGLEDLLKVRIVDFNYKKDNERKEPSDRTFTGVIAQEVAEVFPEAVEKNKDGFFSVDSTPIHWAVINAIKELYAKWLGDHEELEKVKAENAAIKRQNEQLTRWICKQDPSAQFCGEEQ